MTTKKKHQLKKRVKLLKEKDTKRDKARDILQEVNRIQNNNWLSGEYLSYAKIVRDSI